MIRTITEAIVDGYGPQETDFAARLKQADSQVQEAFESEIMQPLLAVLATSDESAALTITGHADRVDTEGLSREERRQQELQASFDRADSAMNRVQEMVTERFFGKPLPGDFEEMQQLALLPRASGAAVLVEVGESLTEEQRQRNRRVQFRVVHFQPE